MVDSSGEMSKFKVGVPGLHVARSNGLARFRRAVTQTGIGDIGVMVRWQDPIRDVEWFEGQAHPLVVAGFMALAQDHDLDMISEKIESLYDPL